MMTEALNRCVMVGRQTPHGPAPIPQEGRFMPVTECSQISGFSHSVGTCAMKQGACKMTLNIKNGIIREALLETVGCSGMTQSAAMAVEILPGRTMQEALNTDLVCDAINVAMREFFMNISYGRSQSAFSQGGLLIGAALEDLGSTVRSQVGTHYGTVEKGPRWLEVAEGYIRKLALDEENRIIGYSYVNVGTMMRLIEEGVSPERALEKASGTYGRYVEAVKLIDPRKE